MLSSVFASLPFSAADWLVIVLGITLAYVVFGIAGFGTALVAGPVLLHFMPLSQIIPLLVLLEFVAASGNWLSARKAVARNELLRLLPCMGAGCTVGVVFLLQLKSDVLLLLMGGFVTSYAVYNLAVKARPAHLNTWWALPAGAVGGLFGALFGSGGFLYALYLNARLSSPDQVRATQSALISCSTVTRLGLFIFTGVYADKTLLIIAIVMLPVMWVGLWIGRRLTQRLSREAFVRLVTWLLLASGVSLISRYLSI